jgi:hypothetical protein
MKPFFIRRIEPVGDDGNDDVVGQIAAIIHHLGLLADRRAAATAARSISPVESCLRPCFSSSSLA